LLFKVSSTTDAKKLGYAVFNSLKENGRETTLQAVGAGAVNNAIKGSIIARGLAAPQGGELKITPAFVDLNTDGQERTAVQLKVNWN